MTAKHNKKRNTAFLYNVLLTEASNALYKEKDLDKYSKILSILSENFKDSKYLNKEICLYFMLSEAQNIKESVARQLIEEVLEERKKLDNKKLFEEQTRLINRINKEVSPNIYKNHVKNYKNLANNFHLMNNFDSMSPKERAELKESILQAITTKNKAVNESRPVDSIEYNIMVRKFNEKYSTSLNERQRELMKNYLLSISSETDFRIYLNEEVQYLKEKLQEAQGMSEIAKDKEMLEKSEKIMGLLNEFSEKPYNKEMLKNVLKIQQLVEEIQEDDSRGE